MKTFRRHDTLSRMFLTLLMAIALGCLLEAEAIHTWAKRLPVGLQRDIALPVANAWLALRKPLHSELPREQALQAKASLAGYMLAKPPTREPAIELALAPVPTSNVLPLPAPPALALASTTAMPASSALEPNFDNVDVALAGDSMMAVGLAPTLKRWMAEQKNMRAIVAYRSGTGLSRPEVYDWVTELPRMLDNARPSIIICAIGANDAQSVQIGKKVLQFDTPEWDDFFRARMTAYLDIVTRQHAHLLWVGLPEMRSAAFSQKMTHLNALQKEVVERYPNATWMDPSAYIHDARSQGFQQFRVRPGGKLEKVRADDGIHFTDDGASYLLPPIREWIGTAIAKRKMMNTSAMAQQPAAVK